jgi:hypothetical protein
VKRRLPSSKALRRVKRLPPVNKEPNRDKLPRPVGKGRDPMYHRRPNKGVPHKGSPPLPINKPDRRARQR